MRNSSLFFFLIIYISLQFHIHPSNSQQPYEKNNQLNCSNDINTHGYQCDSSSNSCLSYITFRSQPPSYSTPPNIAFLLNSSASQIGDLNNISELDPIPSGRPVIVPVPCSCTRTRTNDLYFQHNAQYKLQVQGETYFSTATKIYQGLTTCQSLMDQNKFIFNNLTVGEQLVVPIRCACPSDQQKARNYKYLVSYLVTRGDSFSMIANMFRVDQQSILDANQLELTDTIYPATTLLVPLKSIPTRINLQSTPSAPTPDMPPVTPNTGSSDSSKNKEIIGIGIGVGILVIALIFFFAWFFLIRPSKKKRFIGSKAEEKVVRTPDSSSVFTPLPTSFTTCSQINNNSGTNSKSGYAYSEDLKLAIGSLTVYKYKDIDRATAKFSEGNRITGSMFKGEFNGDQAVIKILKGNVPNDEIMILKNINHSNIIRLSGYCIHEGNTYLVFEYAENGSLDNWLFRSQKQALIDDDDDSDCLPVLTWKQRVQIAFNVADALNYIHSYIDDPYVHKNVKSSNIVLDSNFRAKITNFGLARPIENDSERGALHMTKHVVGTHGYLAPEYIENGVVTTKLDVFAFGVVMLELLSGKPAIRPSATHYSDADGLLFMEIKKVFEVEDVREKLMGFMDCNLRKEYPLNLAYTMAQLCYKCVDADMNYRPSMSEVSMTLSMIYASSLDWDSSDDLTNSSSLSHT
ncbi:protein LYK5-like [Amaranthus tricolor]|uniref:protein LYK5-like n=1 Tax=Amaranthus tricolor TaxID=29722 RepID=UPI00258D53BA|nr:protein LYK5-like [Amaranthus tricolor]